MERKDLSREWHRIIEALQKEQGMEPKEIAAALSVSRDELRAIYRGQVIPWDADRITAILQDLRSPFDDERFVRGKVHNSAQGP